MQQWHSCRRCHQSVPLNPLNNYLDALQTEALLSRVQLQSQRPQSAVWPESHPLNWTTAVNKQQLEQMSLAHVHSSRHLSLILKGSMRILYISGITQAFYRESLWEKKKKKAVVDQWNLKSIFFYCNFTINNWTKNLIWIILGWPQH